MTVDKALSVDSSLDSRILEIIDDSSCLPDEQWVKKYGKLKCWEVMKSLIREVCEEVIGQNVPTGKNASKHRFQNTLRNEQRTKLNNLLKESEGK